MNEYIYELIDQTLDEAFEEEFDIPFYLIDLTESTKGELIAYHSFWTLMDSINYPFYDKTFEYDIIRHAICSYRLKIINSFLNNKYPLNP